MPKPVRDDHKYLPGLDGLRAIAVTVVIAYHLGYRWAQGGLLGVGVFFTLSGFLITKILVDQWDRAGRLRLLDFWVRRARRLLPALFVMLAAVAVWVTVAARSHLPGLRGDIVASALYVSNWWYISQHASYYAQFSPPGPLDHLWSLADEEQFYLIWPWLLLLGLWLLCRRPKPTGRPTPRQWTPRQWTPRRWPTSRRRPGPRRRPVPRRWVLAGAALALAAASALAMARFYHPGYDPTRVYEGTDTRAFGLLVGAALALVWPSQGPAGRRPRLASAAVDLTGAAGLAGIGVLVWRTTEYTPNMFRGGLVLLSVATAAVVAAAATPGSITGRVLGCPPLRWIGVRSYGMYLWHYPIIVLTAPPLGTAFGLRQAIVAVAATVAISAVSWTLIEEPIRRGRRPRLPLLSWARRQTGPALATGGAALALLAGAAVAVPRLIAHEEHVQAEPASLGHRVPAITQRGQAGNAAIAAAPPSALRGVRLTAPSASPATAGSQGEAAQSASPGRPATTGSSSGAGKPRTGQPLRTACQSVVHVGDSTSEGLVSPDYLPNPSQRITARYAAVGVKHQNMQISGGRSIVERLPGQQNAYTVARRIVASGYHGCWVLALGTDDTADVAVGSNVSLDTRIQRMMSVIGNQPVLWVNVRTLVPSGPYSERNMISWNKALAQALAHYPNMRIYDWASVAQPGWFISDGIHYTSNGYEHRAQLIADALATAFPAGNGK
jgi:peptidoglycan/LPS O-acetylase OafA/YrhL